jgi:hypothetical protein
MRIKDCETEIGSHGPVRAVELLGGGIQFMNTRRPNYLIKQTDQLYTGCPAFDFHHNQNFLSATMYTIHRDLLYPAFHSLRTKGLRPGHKAAVT